MMMLCLLSVTHYDKHISSGSCHQVCNMSPAALEAKVAARMTPSEQLSRQQQVSNRT